MPHALRRLPAPDPRWLEWRKGLHKALLDEVGGIDASRLAYLGQVPEQLDEEAAAEIWAQQARRSSYARPPANHLYVHVPFCKSICDFCNYDRLKPGKEESMVRWSRRVLQSIETMGAATRDMTFHTLYFGGGTPSMLTEPLLASLLGAIDAHFTFHPQAMRSFEFDPAVLSQGKTQLLSRHGIRRVSFGIQTFDEGVNSAHSRGRQGFGLVERRLTELSEAGIHQVGCDFLMGLGGSDPDAIMDDVDRLLAHPLAPNSVDIFFLVPTESYVSKHFGGDRDRFEAHLRHHQEVATKRLPDIARRHGYSTLGNTGHGYMLSGKRTRGGASRPASPHVYCQYTYLQGVPLNLLGLGTSARSHLFGASQMTYRDPGDDAGAEGPPTYEVRRMSELDEARTYLITKLRDSNHVDADEFGKVFTEPMDALLGDVIATWAELGLASFDGARLELAEQPPRERMRTLMWGASDEGLEMELLHHRECRLSPDELAYLTGTPTGSAPLGVKVLSHGTSTTTLRDAGHDVVVRWGPSVTPKAPRVVPRVFGRLSPAGKKVVGAMHRGIIKSLKKRRPLPVLDA